MDTVKPNFPATSVWLSVAAMLSIVTVTQASPSTLHAAVPVRSLSLARCSRQCVPNCWLFACCFAALHLALLQAGLLSLAD